METQLMGEIRKLKSSRGGDPPRESTQRRLAAIVAGDITAGSSKPPVTDLLRFSTVLSKLCDAVSSSSKTWLDATHRCRGIIGSSIGLGSILATLSSKQTTFSATASILLPALRVSPILAKSTSQAAFTSR